MQNKAQTKPNEADANVQNIRPGKEAAHAIGHTSRHFAQQSTIVSHDRVVGSHLESSGERHLIAALGDDRWTNALPTQGHRQCGVQLRRERQQFGVHLQRRQRARGDDDRSKFGKDGPHGDAGVETRQLQNGIGNVRCTFVIRILNTNTQYVSAFFNKK
jgi:hypothetical protein